MIPSVSNKYELKMSETDNKLGCKMFVSSADIDIGFGEKCHRVNIEPNKYTVLAP